MAPHRWWAPVPDPDDGPRDWPALVTVAATVLGEAEGEPLIGKRAVAYVIMNRSRDARRRWSRDPADVCLQPLQFSCWNDGSPRIKTMTRPRDHVSELTWSDCFRAALDAMFSIEPDPTGGANHYLAPRSLGKRPSWADASKITATIGAHVFFRL